MDIQLDIWLRGTNHATSDVISPVLREPRAWTDDDVEAVLVGMLRAIDRAKNPETQAERPVALRGFSWIVNPFDSGGVLIALELSLGAVIAGPFDIAGAGPQRDDRARRCGRAGHEARIAADDSLMGRDQTYVVSAFRRTNVVSAFRQTFRRTKKIRPAG